MDEGEVEVTVAVPLPEDEAAEIEAEETAEDIVEGEESWQDLRSEMLAMMEAMQRQAEATNTLSLAVESLRQIPATLNELLQSQQAMIVEQNQILLKALLTPKPEALTEARPEPTLESVEVASPEAETKGVPLSHPRRRRLI